MKEQRRGPQLREALFQDYEQICLLEAKYGLETKNREEWEHLWTGNPAYRDFDNHWPIGWVLEDDKGRLVGYLGNIPLSYEFQHRKLTAAVTHAWVVDSSHRSYSILLLDSYFRQKTGNLFLSTTVNSQASTAFGAFNSPHVPVGNWDRSAFWITHYYGFSSSWIRMKSARMRLLAAPLSAVLLADDVLAGRFAKRDRHEVQIERLDSFDKRFDIFWETMKERYPHLLLAVRSGEVLEWHFRYAIKRKNVWILAVTNGSELSAYSIFCRQDNQRFGLKRMRLVDFQALDGSTSLLAPILSYALKQCRVECIDMLECIGFSPQSEVFENLGPRQRKLPSWMYFYKARDPQLAANLENPKAWNPSWFDGDSTL